ncbi:MAG: hypothetical protein GQ561_09615 [Calditrichae bacterium]|nr:hypothetical protein [Calditrichia bacterium]
MVVVIRVMVMLTFTCIRSLVKMLGVNQHVMNIVQDMDQRRIEDSNEVANYNETTNDKFGFSMPRHLIPQLPPSDSAISSSLPNSSG